MYVPLYGTLPRVAGEKPMSVEGPRLVGLIGHPVGHSRSPVMQQAAFDALGIAARYEPDQRWSLSW